MRRSAWPVLAVVLCAFLPPATSWAAVGPTAGSPGAALADLDADGVSDALEPKLRELAPGDRVSVVVTFDGPGGVATARSAVGAFDVSQTFELVHGFAANMTKAQVIALAGLPGVFRVEQNIRLQAFMDTADADFGTEAARADFGVTGTGVEVCVVDTGVDPNHEQLDGKAPIAFFDAVGGQTLPYDDNGHGTHVAAIATGDSTGGPSASEFGGVAPGASLSVAKVLNALGSGTLAQVIAGIEWCAGRPSVRVISMSLGSTTPSDGQDGTSQAVNAAVAAGKVVVVAAGNSGDDPGTIGSPGAAAGAITVGAVAEWSAAPGASNHSDGVYLAPFSSRGPTLDGRAKPDVAAPGVSITSADAGTTAAYVTSSGTSMATPFVSGAVALALQAAPGWSPADVRTALEGTAADRGVPGKDSDYGAGLIDGHAFVGVAAGGGGATPFPAWSAVSGNVPDHGLWSYPFDLGSDALGVPIAATIIADGAPVCVFGIPGFCLDYDWGPDLEARLVDPNGVQLDLSTCPVGDECGNGRQETVHAMPTTAGTYHLEVFPTEDAPHSGRGGTFRVDLSTGPAGGAPPPPPPPPPTPIVHVGDLDGVATPLGAARWTATVTITVHDLTHGPRAGVTVAGTWGGKGSGVTCVTDASGTCSASRQMGNKNASATFSVTGMSLAGSSYDAGSNHDPDGDSSGTSLTVARP